jgi:hypothetical protein
VGTAARGGLASMGGEGSSGSTKGSSGISATSLAGVMTSTSSAGSGSTSGAGADSWAKNSCPRVVSLGVAHGRRVSARDATRAPCTARESPKLDPNPAPPLAEPPAAWPRDAVSPMDPA